MKLSAALSLFVFIHVHPIESKLRLISLDHSIIQFCLVEVFRTEVHHSYAVCRVFAKRIRICFCVKVPVTRTLKIWITGNIWNKTICPAEWWLGSKKNSVEVRLNWLLFWRPRRFGYSRINVICYAMYNFSCLDETIISCYTCFGPEWGARPSGRDYRANCNPWDSVGRRNNSSLLQGTQASSQALSIYSCIFSSTPDCQKGCSRGSMFAFHREAGDMCFIGRLESLAKVFALSSPRSRCYPGLAMPLLSTMYSFLPATRSTRHRTHLE